MTSKAMHSGSIFEVRCIFAKIGPETQKYRSGISGTFSFRYGSPKLGLFRKSENKAENKTKSGQKRNEEL
jgi:hypothetical protein